MTFEMHRKPLTEYKAHRKPGYRKSPPQKEFLVCPGYVVSKFDGDTHYISEHKLMHLYNVDPRECVISCCPAHHHEDEGLLHLEPNYDGDYSLPDVRADPCLPYQSDDSIVQLAIVKTIQHFSEVFYVVG
jgi:hypothetical protein